MTDDTERTAEITLTVRIKDRALFLKVLQATVEEGEYEGTTYATNVGGGTPIVDVKRNGESVATVWIGLQDLMAAMIGAAVAERP